jgi:hypothetical protein
MWKSLTLLVIAKVHSKYVGMVRYNVLGTFYRYWHNCVSRSIIRSGIHWVRQFGMQSRIRESQLGTKRTKAAANRVFVEKETVFSANCNSSGPLLRLRCSTEYASHFPEPKTKRRAFSAKNTTFMVCMPWMGLNIIQVPFAQPKQVVVSPLRTEKGSKIYNALRWEATDLLGRTSYLVFISIFTG